MKRRTDFCDFRTLFITFAAVFVAGLCHCDKATGSFALQPATIPTGNFIVETDEAIIEPDSIVLLINSCDCYSDTLLHPFINRTAYHYALTGSDLIITIRDSVAAVCTTSHYLRFSKSSGTGLTGSWVFDSTWHDFKGKPSKADTSSAAATYKTILKTGYEWIKIDNSVVTIYTNPDTTTFASDFIAQYESSLATNYITGVMALKPNIVQIIGVSYKNNSPNAIFDTLTVTHYFRAGTTIYRTSDTTKYAPDPYYYYSGTMCPLKSLPPWINQYISDNKPIK
jgi:hypothetical protein